MDPTVISPTIQEFKGLRYYLCGKYFQRGKRIAIRLHRAVWETANQRLVPDGFVVHHIDENRSNNAASNLELMVHEEHCSHHNLGHEREFSQAAIDGAREWHGSEAGKEWHREHYLQYAEKLHEVCEFTCEYCSKKFEAVKTGTNRFCSNNCKTQSRRVSGVDNVERVCIGCGTTFSVNRYSRTQNCSKKCAAILTVRKRNASRA